MEKRFDFLYFIKTLIYFSPRQLEKEKKSADFIISCLKNNNISYYQDYFWSRVPKIEKAILKVDKREIPCQGCSFVSGEIKDKDYLISSLIPSRFFLDKANINFNPKCSQISLSNFYFAPAIAISRDKVPLILRAKKVEGKLMVKKVNHRAVNILVGNKKDPKNICFAHYDSILKGAIDNASGVAVMMAVILAQPERLGQNLFVFSANEELSYDRPTYWGHGFRIFERKYKKILEKVKKIIVLDCLGNGKTKIFKNDYSIYLAFPIKNRDKWKKKILILAGDVEHLMSVYHSNADDIEGIKLKYLKGVTKKFLTLLC